MSSLFSARRMGPRVNRALCSLLELRSHSRTMCSQTRNTLWTDYSNSHTYGTWYLKFVCNQLKLFKKYNRLVNTLFSFFFRVIFLFHKNNNKYTKAKVQPPRLNGLKVGLFSTRSPYRPNPVGLSLLKLERIEGIPVLFVVSS